MTYPTLGYDPAPGSPGTVRGVATALGIVAADAESITSRLRLIGNGAGDAVWRGSAASAFHLLLADVGPDVIRLASAHREAQVALLHYADALERAQDTARGAESDAARATTDRDQQTSARRRAAAEAAQQDRQTWECRRQITQSQATRLLWAADPVYQAELLRYETQTRGIQHRAESLAAEARGRENSARSAELAAAARIDAARRLGNQAQEVRDSSARHTVERLDATGGLPPWARQLVRTGTALIDLLTPAGVVGMLTEPANQVGRYRRGWTWLIDQLENGGPQRDLLRYKRSAVLQWLSRISTPLSGPLAALRRLTSSRLALLVGLSDYLVQARTDVDQLRHHATRGDGWGVTSEFLSVSGRTLQLVPNPVVYLTGYAARQWGDVITMARQVEWTDPGLLDDVRRYGWDSLKDAPRITVGKAWEWL